MRTLDKQIQESKYGDIDIESFYSELVRTLLRSAKEAIPSNTFNPHTKP